MSLGELAVYTLGQCPIEAGLVGNLADNECRHGRLPNDRSPECGCWKPVITIEEARQLTASDPEAPWGRKKDGTPRQRPGRRPAEPVLTPDEARTLSPTVAGAIATLREARDEAAAAVEERKEALAAAESEWQEISAAVDRLEATAA